MQLNKIAATAVLVAAITGVAGTAASAQPHTAAGQIVYDNDRSISYRVEPAQDHHSAVVTPAGGHFAVRADGAAVDVVAPSGHVIEQLPMTLSVANRQLRLTPVAAASGTKLMISPVDGPTPALWVPELVAAGIGCAIGALIGVWFFVVGAIPGCIALGAAGALIGANT